MLELLFEIVISLFLIRTEQNRNFIYLFFYLFILSNALFGNFRPDVPLHTKVINYEIIAVGFIAGVASTYSALKSLITDHFTVPCYVNPVDAGH